VVAPSGDLGGVGFRPLAQRLVLVATDIGFVFEPDGIDPYVGVDGVTVPASEFMDFHRDTTPGGRGAAIQETVDALNALQIQTIGLGTNSDADSDPRQSLEAMATLTGAVNQSDTAITAASPVTRLNRVNRCTS
jgi:hypothetical protein